MEENSERRSRICQKETQKKKTEANNKSLEATEIDWSRNACEHFVTQLWLEKLFSPTFNITAYAVNVYLAPEQSNFEALKQGYLKIEMNWPTISDCSNIKRLSRLNETQTKMKSRLIRLRSQWAQSTGVFPHNIISEEALINICTAKEVNTAFLIEQIGESGFDRYGKDLIDEIAKIKSASRIEKDNSAHSPITTTTTTTTIIETPKKKTPTSEKKRKRTPSSTSSTAKKKSSIVIYDNIEDDQDEEVGSFNDYNEDQMDDFVVSDDDLVEDSDVEPEKKRLKTHNSNPPVLVVDLSNENSQQWKKQKTPLIKEDSTEDSHSSDFEN